MRKTDSFLSRDERKQTRLCCSGSANTRWNHTCFMTRNVPTKPRQQYRNVIARNCCRQSDPRQFHDMFANHPEKGF